MPSPKATQSPARPIPRSTCPIETNGAKWLADMHGITKSDAGQAYYDSLFQLYADWGVDFVKVDDLDTTSGVYYRDEIDMIRAAIDKTGRPIVLSVSPGPVPLSAAEHIAANANMWRVANDFWDRWIDIVPQFERLNKWTPYRSAGHWPDADMLPLGRIAIRGEVGTDRLSKFTHDEQRTLMTLWCIARSPLIFGGDLPIERRLDQIAHHQSRSDRSRSAQHEQSPALPRSAIRSPGSPTRPMVKANTWPCSISRPATPPRSKPSSPT